jgi:hypothetical protein
MKHAVTAFVALALALAACGTPPGEAPQPASDDVAGGLTAAETENVTRIGEEAAQALREGLSARLSAALAAGAPEDAIGVCADEAMPLTDSIAAATRVLGVKRTSLRVRNPRNDPDALERAALEWFADREGGEPRPTLLVQRDDGDYRYYSPLRVAAMCTSCHGPAESLPDPVRSALRERYPDDKATGYAEGDLRGLIRVTVPAAAVATGGSPPRQ